MALVPLPIVLGDESISSLVDSSAGGVVVSIGPMSVFRLLLGTHVDSTGVSRNGTSTRIMTDEVELWNGTANPLFLPRTRLERQHVNTLPHASCTMVYTKGPASADRLVACSDQCVSPIYFILTHPLPRSAG